MVGFIDLGSMSVGLEVGVGSSLVGVGSEDEESERFMVLMLKLEDEGRDEEGFTGTLIGILTFIDVNGFTGTLIGILLTCFFFFFIVEVEGCIGIGISSCISCIICGF